MSASVISHYRRKMERHLDDPGILLHCLSKLDRVEVNIALLQETGIGRTVNSLKKSDPEEVAEKARILVSKWKEVVAKEDDEEDQTQNDNEEEEEEEVVAEEVEESPPPPPVKEPTPPPPPSSSSSSKSSSHHKKHKKKKKSSHKESSSSSSSSSHNKKSKKESSDSFGDALMSIPSVSKKKKQETSGSSYKSPSTPPPPSPISLPKPSSSSSNLIPTPSTSSDLLPSISPNYKPLPPKKDSVTSAKKYQNDDEALSSLISMSKSSKRTAVFSGVKKTGYTGPIPTLMNMCIVVLQENVDDIYECGGLDYTTLKPVLERASSQTLAQIEEHNHYLMTDTGDLWKRFCVKNFPKEKRQELESWREMFDRCTMEREQKLDLLKVKVKDSYKKVESSYRQTKLAYVGTVAKPPRNVLRTQAKNGTALPVGHSLKRPMANAGGGPSSSSSKSSSFSSAPKKPKVAPLMSKTLKMARGIKGGFRR